MADKPLCIYCHKEVRDYRSLKHSVTWEAGEKAGMYAHSRCFIESGDMGREIERAFAPMDLAVKALLNKLEMKK